MNRSLGRQAFFGVAAGIGLIGTWYFNLRAMTSGAGARDYVQGWFANDASSSAAVDLIVLASALTVFMIVEGRRLKMRLSLLYVVLGFTVAMAFALPLFLLMRERTLAARAHGAALRPERVS